MRPRPLLLLLLLALPLLPAPSALGKSRETKRSVTIGGKKCKLWHGFWENGKRWYVHTWCGGKRHGTHLNYNKQGVKVAQVTWRRDYRHGPFKRWHANGKLAAHGRHHRAHRIGRYTRYWPNGKKALVARYDRRGALDGAYRTFHATGRPHIEGRYKAGVPDGVWTARDDSGKVKRRAKLAGGKLLGLTPGPQKASGLRGRYGAGDFALLMAWGSGLSGYNVLRVDARGRAEMSFRVGQLRVNAGELKGSPRGEIYRDINLRRYTFHLSGKAQRELRAMLAREKAHALAKSYVNRDVHDGTQWQFKLRLGGVKHTVYCSNQFPPAMRRISDYLRKKVLAPHTFEKLLALKAPAGASRDVKLR